MEGYYMKNNNNTKKNTRVRRVGDCSAKRNLERQDEVKPTERGANENLQIRREQSPRRTQLVTCNTLRYNNKKISLTVKYMYNTVE